MVLIKKVILFIFSTWRRTQLLALRVLAKLHIISTPYHPLPWVNLRIKKNREKSIFDRWQCIEEQIQESRSSVLDVGCNVGYYSISLARKGHYVVGVEGGWASVAIATCARDVLGVHNALFHRLDLTPDNIDSLPSFDYVIMLAVFHHWCRSYGKEPGITMLKTLCRKVKKGIIFETGQPDTASRKYVDALPDMGDDVLEWLLNFFTAEGFNSAESMGYFQSRHLIVARR